MKEQCIQVSPSKYILVSVITLNQDKSSSGRQSQHTYILDKDLEMRRHLLWKQVHTVIKAETSNEVICKLGNTQDK